MLLLLFCLIFIIISLSRWKIRWITRSIGIFGIKFWLKPKFPESNLNVFFAVVVFFISFVFAWFFITLRVCWACFELNICAYIVANCNFNAEFRFMYSFFRFCFISELIHDLIFWSNKNHVVELTTTTWTMKTEQTEEHTEGDEHEMRIAFKIMRKILIWSFVFLS